MPSDWRGNFDLRSGRVKCHDSFDLVWGPNRDWARCSGDIYRLQKIFLFLAIPQGEVLNEPTMGCCLHNYIFKKMTDTTICELQIKLEQELKTQLSDLGIMSVNVARNAQNSGGVNIKITGKDFSYLLQAHGDDLLTLNLLEAIGQVGFSYK
ncbi:MAG: hypothetical protein A4E48_00274 [Methanosaeta sp. PtaU1.Bin060]|nr:MAG: hypothetical protein A4E48_00274 [Methanosaeta sp. PtaU1.Bin060]